jgi:hypothetical protein
MPQKSAEASGFAGHGVVNVFCRTDGKYGGLTGLSLK